VNREGEADVLVIGAGAAGAAAAWSLSQRGARVVCLEQGEWIPPERRPKSHLDWEVRTRRYWSPSPNLRQWPADYPVASFGADPINVLLYNCVGGSTIGYAANYWHLSPSDFRVRTLDGVGIDWPISYQDLAPYYTRNERILGVAGLVGDPWSPPREPLPLPPAPLGNQGRIVLRGFEKLGWEYWPTEQAIATRPYDGRAACDFRSFCPFGCPPGAMSSADVTYWPKALKNGVELHTNARVREISLHPNGRARGAIYYDVEGRAWETRARLVLVSCGGIGTPRLLLMSTSSQHPDGLANSSGLVGRNLMVHIQTFAVGLFEDRVDAWKGTWGGSLSTRQFYETDPRRKYVRGFVMSGCPGWSPLNLALQLAPWGAQHHETLAHYLNHEVVVFLCGEDLPAESNRVELDWEHLDEFGMPGAKTHYTLDENGKRLGADMIDHGRRLLDAAGAVSVRDFGLSPLIGWHLLGTARMGTDPLASVVDSDHRAHDVSNLFIVDGSSFTTSAGVNPTSTIQALALRCADRIWQRRRDWQ